MKILNRILMISGGVFLLLLSACTEDYPEREPSPVTPANCVGAYFPSSNILSYELNPSDPTIVSVTISRINTSGAVSVPITVVSNPDNVFSVPGNVEFASGAETATFDVSFPEAAIGTNYTLEIAVEGEQYVDHYTETEGFPTIAVSVIRVKWDNLGTGQFYDSFTLYSVAEITLQYSENIDMYRFANPYSQELLEEAEWGDWIGGPTTEYIQFQITSDGLITWDSFWYIGCTYEPGGTPIKAYFPSFLSESLADSDAESKVDPDNDKVLIFNPYWYVDGLGGWGLVPCYLSMPGGPDLAEYLGF